MRRATLPPPTHWVQVRRCHGNGDWSLAWRTPIMPGLAFWHFPTEAEATEAAERILGHRLDESCPLCPVALPGQAAILPAWGATARREP